MKSYVISVSLGTGRYRHIRIGASATFAHLHTTIRTAFDFDDDHEHAFYLNDRLWDDDHAIMSEAVCEDRPASNACILSEWGLEPGKKFKYLFDFGRNWTFQCKVLRELDEETHIPGVIRRVGEAPDQYSREDEDDLTAEDDLEEWSPEAEEELREMVSQLREVLPVATEITERIVGYIAAAARLYGVVSLEQVMELYNSQNRPESLHTFRLLAELFSLGDASFYLAAPQDEEEADPDPAQTWVVSVYLEDDEDINALLAAQEDRPYRILKPEELLPYADENYFPDTPESEAMKRYIFSHPELRDPEELLDLLRFSIEEDAPVRTLMEMMESFDWEENDRKDFETFLTLLQDLNNRSRKRVLRGYTPEELYRQFTPEKPASKAKKKGNKSKNSFGGFYEDHRPHPQRFPH